jgi:hypothetical protein
MHKLAMIHISFIKQRKVVSYPNLDKFNLLYLYSFTDAVFRKFTFLS